MPPIENYSINKDFLWEKRIKSKKNTTKPTQFTLLTIELKILNQQLISSYGIHIFFLYTSCKYIIVNHTCGIIVISSHFYSVDFTEISYNLFLISIISTNIRLGGFYLLGEILFESRVFIDLNPTRDFFLIYTLNLITIKFTAKNSQKLTEIF